MRYSEKEMQEILSQDIQISDTVDHRIHDTYKMLKAGQRQEKKHPRRKFPYMAAAIAAVCCLAIPGAVYAAVNSDFFDGMLGNSTKKSTPAITKEVDNGKGGTTSVTLPSHEYVPVDEEKAQELIGNGELDTPIEKQLGEHTLRVENMVYDKNSALIYFTLEREGGVMMLVGDADTNAAKGAYCSGTTNHQFSFDTTSEEIFGADNIYVDQEKSTPEKMYCYSYIIWSDSLPDGVFPALSIIEYPCPIREMERTDASDEEWEAFYAAAKHEDIILTGQAPIPVQRIDMGEKGCLEYSPISISLDLARGLGLSQDEACDPYHLWHLEIRYKNGSNYIVSDAEDNIENSSYILGTGTWYKTTFNRLVDVDEIKEIVVNDVAFPVD